MTNLKGEYRITKLEKGPLQRFKNQNLLLKKFGEVGLQIYKAITGKRTTDELRKDLGVDAAMFNQVIDFMVDAGMISLEPAGKARVEKAVAEEAPPEEEKAEEEKPPRSLEELPPEEELVEEKETPPLEEQPQEKAEQAGEELEIKPEFEEEAPPKKPAKKKKEEKKEEAFEEIRPIEMEAPPEEEAKPEEEEKPEEEAEEISPVIEEEAPPEAEEEMRPEAPAAAPEESGMSPVEKIIFDKYGDIGLRVYALIDGQRTAEEIMRDTGLTESKLVEILDFMDEQGIIKLDYPKGQAPAGGMAPAVQAGEEKKELAFVPMIEGEESLEESGPVPSPIEVPVKAPLDIIKSVQLKAKLMLKYGDKSNRILEQMDGRRDVLDMALRLDMPLYSLTDILRFMMENGMIMMKPMPRADVRKKYGDDGYAVYKRYGKEGLMLYELIGKELTIKQMADKITTDKAKIIDMFIFIHKVLGIELPLDRAVLAKQLGM